MHMLGLVYTVDTKEHYFQLLHCIDTLSIFNVPTAFTY